MSVSNAKNLSIDSLLMSKNLNMSTINSSSPQLNSIQTRQQYRKIRPEQINEKTLVGSVVGFLQDVVGADSTKSTPNHSTHSINKPIINNSNHTHNQSQNLQINELKEEIEWLHFENYNLKSTINQTTNTSTGAYLNCNIILLIGYKTGFSLWTIDLNGVATEALSIREPNIKHVKLIQIENNHRLLIAISKLIIEDDLSSNSNNLFSLMVGENHSNESITNESSNNTNNNTQHLNHKKYNISILNLFNGECLREIVFNGEILEMKSNLDLLCVNSWNRIDAFDLNTFEHKFTINSCYSQISKSTGKIINPFALGSRWIAFADNKYHGMLGSMGGVSTDIEQSYTATVLNTAKSISKGLVKISESVVNSVVSKSKSNNTNQNSSNGGISPRGSGKKRHDSKDELRAGICTIIDTKKFINTSYKQQNLHDENQNWIIAHFLAHQDPIYALEFNPTGRLLVTTDSLGQYFNVFQINSNSFKCTRTIVKHLYSLYRGDTNAKVRNITFSNDSRWLAIGTKRGTTHIFPINLDGGPVNARTHSKSYVVNRTSKHQRTAGFIDQDELLNLNKTNNNTTPNDEYMNGPGGLSEYSYHSPTVINNNPKLKYLLEPFIIPAYGQLKQPNANSTFQSSIISGGANHSNSTGLLACVTSSHHTNSNIQNQSNVLNSNLGTNIAASALQSAALVTENVTNFGIKNFSLFASNTTNMIQYDNVQAVALFAETRGYLSPEEPREFTLNRTKPVNSLFVISDVNGNLVEYVLDIVLDTSKVHGNKPTNDTPIQLKITPKAQWPLQRFISSDEVRYPLNVDNPLMKNNFGPGCVQRQNSISNDTYNYSSYSPNSLLTSNSRSIFTTPPTSLNCQQTVNNNEWIKLIEINTHIGPHRRLFMGPQFQFKTFNSNLTTTMVNATSSSVISDSETPIIDLSGDIELNSLDLSLASRKINNTMNNKFCYNSTLPMQIKSKKFDCTPTFIEIGAGSFQEGMPICGSNGSRGSQKSLNNPVQCDLLGDNLIESLADAMNELNPIGPTQINSKNQIHSPAIAIANNSNNNNNNNNNVNNYNNNNGKLNDPNLLLMNANSAFPSSVGSSSSSVFTVGSYFLINPSIPIGNGSGPTVNTSLASCTSSSSASSSASSGSTSSSTSQTDIIRRSRNHNFSEGSSIENNLFHDENLLQ